MRRLLLASAAAILLPVLGGCVSSSEAPAPEQRPVPVPTPAPTPAPAPPPPASADWRDWPLTPGTWAYRRDARGSIALFGRAGSDAELTLRCDLGRRTVYLSRRGGTGAAQLTIRTTSLARSLAMRPAGGEPPYLAAEIGPRDSLLDAMGYSRGRIVVEGGGLPTIVVPAWAEILRVTEDCR